MTPGEVSNRLGWEASTEVVVDTTGALSKRDEPKKKLSELPTIFWKASAMPFRRRLRVARLFGKSILDLQG
jgi:hypothetical protein